MTGLCTINCGCEDNTDMEAFSEERREWLCKSLEFHGGPDNDTFRRLFERV